MAKILIRNRNRGTLKFSVLKRGRGALWVTAALGLALLASPSAGGVPLHGLALGGKPKYAETFRNFDYADPNALKGGALTLSVVGSFDTLNPFALKGRGASGLGLYVFESLMEHALDEPFSIYGLLAQSMDVAEDGLSVTFRLRPEARFSDGKPVQAQDVAYTFNTLRGEGVQPFYKLYYADVKAVETPDARTVVFRFARRNNELPMILGEVPVLPRHVYQGKDFGRDFVGLAMGSGPYTVDSFDFGKNLRFRRNPKYWGEKLAVNAGKNNFDTIAMKYYKDQTVALEAFKAGEFDFLWISSSKQWAVDVAGDKWDRHWILKENLKHSNSSGMQGYVFNQRKPLFTDRRVRHALALAFDFEWSNQNLFYGQYTEHDSYYDNSDLAAEGLPSPEELKLLEPQRAHLAPEVFTRPMGPAGADPANLRERLRAAVTLLKDAGWVVKDGVLTQETTGAPMRFTVMLDSPAFERITEPYLNNLKKLGVQADMKVVDSAVYEQKVRTFDFDMIVDVFGQSQSPGNEQREFWHSASAGQEGSRNTAGLRNPGVDALVDAVITANNRATLTIAVRALDRALWNEYLAVPHWFIASHRVTYWNKLRYPKTLPKYFNPLSHLSF
ncbi:MAG: extracellular solute-binding protein [Deltaproteobacteria bacterium]|nr:extracellular solute-binding protein [Deltaproteobacteria bacterium]